MNCLDRLLQMPHESFSQESRCINRDSNRTPPPFHNTSPQRYRSTNLLRHPSYFCSSPIRSVQVPNSTWVQFLDIKENKENQKANSQSTAEQNFVGYSVCRHVQRCTHTHTHTNIYRSSRNSSCKVILTPNAIHHPRQSQRQTQMSTTKTSNSIMKAWEKFN